MNVAERIRANPASLPHGGTDASLVPADPATGGGGRMILNLFFEERDDRWFPGDRHIRPLLRRVLLGKSWISGQRRVFLNLCAGLDRLGIRYRVNDYGYIRKHSEELACIIGRPFVLDWFAWKNPLLLGVAMYNHPMETPGDLKDLSVKSILVPCAWYADMCRPYWPHVEVWPVGIETDLWTPAPAEQKSVDVLLYDKVRWEHERYETGADRPDPQASRSKRPLGRSDPLRPLQGRGLQGCVGALPQHGVPVRARKPGHRLPAGAFERCSRVCLGSRRPVAGSGVFSAQGDIRGRRIVGALFRRTLRQQIHRRGRLQFAAGATSGRMPAPAISRLATM